MADRQPPVVSVVIPVYNGGRYLADAIDSVLSQRPGPLEIIAVDDGSTDDSSDVLRRYGHAVRYVGQPNAGPNAARNAGIGLAQGRFLAFLDQDDLWLPHKLEDQLAALDDDTGPDVVFGHVEQFVSPDVAASSTLAMNSPLRDGGPGYIPSTMLARRSSFMRVGLLDQSLRVGELIDWMSRAQQFGIKMDMLPAVVVRRRLHSTNLGRLEPHSRIDYVRALKARIDRSRTRLTEDEPSRTSDETPSGR
jgi:glycosyltransferase involved in cell wall biosynthesis